MLLSMTRPFRPFTPWSKSEVEVFSSVISAANLEHLLMAQKIIDHPIESGSEFQLGQVKFEFHIGVPRPKRSEVAQRLLAQRLPTPTPKSADQSRKTVQCAPLPGAGTKKLCLKILFPRKFQRNPKHPPPQSGSGKVMNLASL